MAHIYEAPVGYCRGCKNHQPAHQEIDLGPFATEPERPRCRASCHNREQPLLQVQRRTAWWIEYDAHPDTYAPTEPLTEDQARARLAEYDAREAFFRRSR